MSNREENLKKIDDELEKLSDEELEKISGGYVIDYLDPMINNIIKLFENNKNKSNTNS